MYTTREKPAYDELEDSFMRVRDDNKQLKQRLTKQEDKIKMLSTQLVRITQDVKRQSETAGPREGRRRDVEGELVMEDLRAQLATSFRQNEKLKNQLQLHRLTMQQMKPKGPYSNVRARVNTGQRLHTSAGITKKMIPLMSGKVVTSVNRGAPPGFPPPFVMIPIDRPPTPPSARSTMSSTSSSTSPKPELERISAGNLYVKLQEDADYPLDKVELSSLVELIHYLLPKIFAANAKNVELQKECGTYSNEIAEMKSKLLYAQEKLKGLEETLTKKHEQLNGDAAEAQRLQLELNERNAEYKVLQTKYDFFEKSLTALKEAHAATLKQLADTNQSLFEEKSGARVLEAEFKERSKMHERTEKELQQLVDHLKEDKEQAQALVNKHLQTGNQKEQLFDEERATYKGRIAQLEERLRNGGDDTTRLEELRRLLSDSKSETQRQKDRVQALTTELSQTQGLREQIQRLSLEASHAGPDAEQLRQLLADSKKREADMQKRLGEEQRKNLKSLHEQDEGARADIVQLAQDLEAARQLLQSQEDLMRQQKRELAEKQEALEELRKHYEMKLEDQARMLDFKQQHARKLQQQVDALMHKSTPLRTLVPAGSVFHEEAALSLAPDENALELVLVQVTLNTDRLPPDVDTFFVFDFFEHESVITPVMSGLALKPNFTIYYKTKVDQFFLHYLQSYHMTMDIERCAGFEHTCIGRCMVNFQPLLTEKLPDGGKHFGTAEIFSVDDRSPLGSIQFTLRLLRSINEQLQLLQAQEIVTNPERHLLRSYVKNWLIVKVFGCKSLPARGDNTLPSAFVQYQWFRFPDAITKIVADTCDPPFNDVQSFPVQITDKLEEHLLSHNLDFVAVDDKDPQGDAYIGCASVQLSPLLHGETVEGDFPLLSPQGKPTGATIALHIYWRDPWEKSSIHGLPSATPQPANAEEEPSMGRSLRAVETSEQFETHTAADLQPAQASDTSSVCDDGYSSTSTTFSEATRREYNIREQARDLEHRRLAVESQLDRLRYTQGENERSLMRRTGGLGPLGDTGTSRRSATPSAQRLAASALSPRRSGSASPRGTRSPLKPTDTKRSTRTDLDTTDRLFVGVKIVVGVDRLELSDEARDSLRDDDSIFVGINFLRATKDVVTKQFPASSDQPFTFDFRREYPLENSKYRFALKSLLDNELRGQAAIYFDVYARPQAGGASARVVGTAEVNLHWILKLRQDLCEHDLPLQDRQGRCVGTIWVSITAFDALNTMSQL
eukprot:TRINITY_DN2120_c0_g1_i13.p1 TRINITY_DN2120_c0_g1~~TRINITY_DN2120_c0_g1_i13.p1  ORF type:complete len:1244 (-),score=372.49 TRINITY_DN2120_c0_g1_i13:99-3830(-)